MINDFVSVSNAAEQAGDAALWTVNIINTGLCWLLCIVFKLSFLSRLFLAMKNEMK